jgi:hypothetical protein
MLGRKIELLVEEGGLEGVDHTVDQGASTLD